MISIINVPIDQLKAAEYNPRNWTDKQLEQLQESIRRFGFAEPVVVNNAEGRQNIVIGGHMRIAAARAIGLSEVPVVYLTLDIAQEKELNLRLNKNTGEWNYDLLKEFDHGILETVGFNLDELSTTQHSGSGSQAGEGTTPQEKTVILKLSPDEVAAMDNLIAELDLTAQDYVGLVKFLINGYHQ